MRTSHMTTAERAVLMTLARITRAKSTDPADVRDLDEVLRPFEEDGVGTVTPSERVDVSVRQPHYGDGRQPWDDVVEAGWGPAFAAANVLKYLRRDKVPEYSLESARWYWRQVVDRSNAEPSWVAPWTEAKAQLLHLLTADERARLSGP